MWPGFPMDPCFLKNLFTPASWHNLTIISQFLWTRMLPSLEIQISLADILNQVECTDFLLKLVFLIHSFIKQVLSGYFVPDTAQGPWDTKMNKTDKVPTVSKVMYCKSKTEKKYQIATINLRLEIIKLQVMSWKTWRSIIMGGCECVLKYGARGWRLWGRDFPRWAVNTGGGAGARQSRG